MALKLQIKERFGVRIQFFQLISNDQMNQKLKIEKIVFNIKQYSEYIYRQYIKSIKKGKNNQEVKQISKHDNALQLDNTLKLLKNYLKKLTVNTRFEKVQDI